MSCPFNTTRLFQIVLLALVLTTSLAHAQYSDEAFEQKQASELYDERGFYQNKAITVDGKLVVANSNGNVSYSYPISAWQVDGYSFSTSLNYCGSVSFSSFGKYTESGTYVNWNKFNQNRPAWLYGVNGFAVQAIALSTSFHADPATITDRFENGSVTEFDDEDFVWTIDGYDICNRMQDFAVGDYNEAESGSPRHVYRDVIKLLKSDGSVLELLNVNDASTNHGVSNSWTISSYLYTGYYVVNEANYQGYAYVEFMDTDELWFNQGYTNLFPDWPRYRPRRVRYYPGDGLEYVFVERLMPFGTPDLWDSQLHYGGVKAMPTTFYLAQIKSAGRSLVGFTYSRHGVQERPVGGIIENADFDSTRGRALLTDFDGHRITYGNSGMSISALGRTTLVYFNKVAYSGNAVSTEEFPMMTYGYRNSYSEALSRVPLTGTSPYKSWVGYVTKIVDPEERETTFDYAEYTRHYINYGFPRPWVSGANIKTSLANYRLTEVVEPSAKYNLYYYNRSGGTMEVDTDGLDTLTVTQGSLDQYTFAFSNAARRMEKRTLGGTLLTTDRYWFLFESLLATAPTIGIVSIEDHLSGRTDSSVYGYERHKLPRSIPKQPEKYYTSLNYQRQYAKLNGVVTDSTATSTFSIPVAPYLWLPQTQTTTVNGFSKSGVSYAYQIDTVRRYGDNDTLIKYHGMEISMQMQVTRSPEYPGPVYRTDTTEYLHIPEFDTTFTMVDTVLDIPAIHHKYDSLVLAGDPVAISTYWGFMLDDPRIRTTKLDTVVLGDYKIPPIFSLKTREWSTDANGTYLGGRHYSYCLLGDCDGGAATSSWFNRLLLRGVPLSDTVIGRSRNRQFPGSLMRYDDARRGLPDYIVNRFGATSRFKYGWPNAPVAQLAVGNVLANDDMVYEHPIQSSSFYATTYSKPQEEIAEVRGYDPGGTLGIDTLHTYREITHYGLTAGTIDPNGWYSAFDYDQNGRLNTAWLPYDFQSPDSIFYFDIDGLEVTRGSGSSTWQEIHSEEHYELGTCLLLPGSTHDSLYTEYFGSFMVNRPPWLTPNCPVGGYTISSTDEKAGASIQSTAYDYIYTNKTPAIATLGMPVQNPASELLSLDSAFLELYVSSVAGECVTLHVTIPAYETFEATYVLNCTPFGSGSGSGVDTVENVTMLRIPLGVYSDSIFDNNDTHVPFRFETTTIDAEVRFVNSFEGDGNTVPRLLLYGTFRKFNRLADYTLHYEHDDENLRSEIWVKVDDSLHTANRGTGGQATLGESRRTMIEHQFGADYRLLKSRTMMGDPESPYRIDSVLAEYTGLGQVVKSTDQIGDTVSTEFDAMGRPVKTYNQDGTYSTIAYYFCGYELTYPVEIGPSIDSSCFGIDPADQDFYGFVMAKVTTNELGTKFVEYYDAFDQMRLQIADSGGLHRVTKYEYDMQGRIVQVVNPALDTTRYWYDDFGRVQYKSQPDLGTISYAYDDLGNPRFVQTQEQWGEDRLTFNEYDDMSRLVIVGEANFAASEGGGGGGGGHGSTIGMKDTDPARITDSTPHGHPDGIMGDDDARITDSTPHGRTAVRPLPADADDAVTGDPDKSGASLLAIPTDSTLNLNRYTDQLDPNVLHDSGASAILTANKTLWIDPSAYGNIVPTFWTLGQLSLITSCSALTAIRPDAVGPYLRHPAATHTPNDVQSTVNDFENLAKYPENVRIAIAYDTLPEIAGAVWSTFPAHSQWEALAPKGELRNLKGREAAVAYREHSGEPYHYSVLSYDERGRVEALIRYTENLGFDAVYYQYNSMNQVIRVITTDPLRRYTTWYGYNQNGQVDSVWTRLDNVGKGLWTSGTGVWAYPPQNLTRPNDAEITYVYTKDRLIDSISYPKISVIAAYEYTPRKWLDTLVATKSSVDLFTQFLTFNNAGQITQQVSQHAGSSSLRQDYEYDALGQLTGWLHDSGGAGEYGRDYDYDSVGNRVTVWHRGAGGSDQGRVDYYIGRRTALPVGPNQITTTAQYGAGSSYLSTYQYTYDPDGSQTQRKLVNLSGTLLEEDFTYSSWRGLISSYQRKDPNLLAGQDTWKWEYRFNAMGEREQKRETLHPGMDSTAANGYEWTYYLLGGSKEQLSVWKGLQTSDATFCGMPGGGGTYVHLYPNEYLTRGGNTASITQKLNNTKEYRLADHLGNNRVVVDNTGAVLSTADYEPFGKPLSGSTEDRLSWIDKERDDENGYGNFGVRSFDYDMGRFTSIDPLWEKYTNFNPYQYSLNTPVRLLDNGGEEVEPKCMTEEEVKQYNIALNLLFDLAKKSPTVSGIINRALGPDSEIHLYSLSPSTEESEHATFSELFPDRKKQYPGDKKEGPAILERDLYDDGSGSMGRTIRPLSGGPQADVLIPSHVMGTMDNFGVYGFLALLDEFNHATEEENGTTAQDHVQLWGALLNEIESGEFDLNIIDTWKVAQDGIKKTIRNRYEKALKAVEAEEAKKNAD